MSTPPLEPQQQQSPPGAVTPHANTTHSGNGSFGVAITVVFVIAFLGVLSGMIGRLFSGRGILGYGQYDFEGWFEKKFSTCIGGRIDNPPTLPPNKTNASAGSVPLATPVETPEETNKIEQPFPYPPETNEF